MTSSQEIDRSQTASAPPGVDLATLAHVSSVLYREARLLDEMRLHEWEEMFTEDGLYWVPLADEPGGPDRTLAIVHDDAQGRRARIYRLLQTRVYDQDPPSRTQHLVSNIEILRAGENPGDGAADDLVVTSTQIVGEVRSGARQVGLNQPRLLMARVEHRLVGSVGDFRIRRKKILLLDRSQALYNMSFLI